MEEQAEPALIEMEEQAALIKMEEKAGVEGWPTDGGKYDWPANGKKEKYDPCSTLASLSPCPCYKQRIGNYYVHVSCGEEPCCVSSPSAWYSCLITLPLIFGIPALALIFYFNVCADPPAWMFYLIVTLWAVTFVLFIPIRFSNPGFLPVPTEEKWRKANPRAKFEDLDVSRSVPREIYSNGKTYTFVAGHGVYVYGFDHFCPWVGNVVAGKNMPCFMAFAPFASSACCIVSILGLYLMVTCGNE